MNALEEQLATLLKQAPGEPPAAVDADALLARVATRRRRRYLAPALAAAVVAAIAVPVAVLLNNHSGTPLANVAPTHATKLPSTGPATLDDPKGQAIRTAQATIDAATVLPGAARRAHSPLAVLNRPPSIPGAQHVQRTRFWTAPGGVDAAIAYLQAHPPAGFRTDGSGSVGGPGVPLNQELDFQAGAFGSSNSKSLLYTVAAYRGGVAVRADAQVIWAPVRPSWSYVPDSVTSVDVTVVRKNPQLHQGAPTVTRTLTADATRSLAATVNRLAEAPYDMRHCPAAFGEWSDALVFHAGSTTLRVAQTIVGCEYLTAADGRHKPINLSGDIDHPVLAALGLPDPYGGR